MGMNIPIMDSYGMSENTGPQSLSTISNWRLGSVGKCLNGTYLKIDNPSDENGEGEVSQLNQASYNNGRDEYTGHEVRGRVNTAYII